MDRCLSKDVLLLYMLFTGALCLEPEFDMPVVNVTVKEFTTAILPCAVKHLGNHQVVWTDMYSTLLAYEDRRIIDDSRLSIERPFTKDWNLHIRKVKYADQGLYNCQINTVPVKVKTVYLIVQVPAKIIDHLSTPDIEVQENDHVTLVCNVTGVPQPEVTWYRHVSEAAGVEKQKVGVNGEVLVIHNVSRYCGGIYECVAFNGVPPAVSRQIEVQVKFAPEINLPNRRIGQDQGRETILECTVTAFPEAKISWMRRGSKVETLSQKYRLETYDEDRNVITLSLRIFSIERHDYGKYTCVASNDLGEDSESMILYDYSAYIKTTPSTTTTTTTTTTARRRPPPRTTQVTVLQPPVLESNSHNSLFPHVEGRGRNPYQRPVNTYHPVTHPDPWVSQRSDQGAGGKVLQSNMGGEDGSSAATSVMLWSSPPAAAAAALPVLLLMVVPSLLLPRCLL
ncbi:limbic system-associated membrane protein-like isoform X2 [Babylonia areolata]|uniref:limbic system-associated membrane protein-like isoform X2 n=1 Tax=Babylonia areolata TaxID=304850 RepID=UPI003FD49A5D